MTYFPPEAKEKIASLLSEVEKLEAKNEEISKELNSLKKKNSSDIDKFNTTKYALFAIIALLIIALVFVYKYVPCSGLSSKEKESKELVVSNLEKENASYKAEIKSLKSKLSAIEEVNELPDLVYKVQIGAFKSFELKGYVPQNISLIETEESGFKKYSLGVFSNYKDALQFKKEVRKLGFKKAFLVVEYKGEKINIKEGIKLENR